MRKLLFVLALVIDQPGPCFGQAINSPAQASAQQVTATSPDLTEATRLSHEVVRLHDQKKYEEALPLAKRALELREKALGPDHELVATSLYNVAGIYRAQSRYADAESFFKHALSILEKKFGTDSKNLTETLEQLAWMRFAQRDNGEAEKLFFRALAIKEKAFGPEHLETARTLSVLGKFYDRSKKPDKAADYYKRSLAVMEHLLGPSHPDLEEALYGCGCALILSGHDDEGRQYHERAKKIRNVAENEPVKRSGVLQGSAILMVEPQYPTAAKQNRVSGSVIVEVTVDECGLVASARALSGPSDLRAAAVAAGRRWRFTPTRLSGHPVKVIGTITFNFNL